MFGIVIISQFARKQAGDEGFNEGGGRLQLEHADLCVCLYCRMSVDWHEIVHFESTCIAQGILNRQPNEI
jgi:hypothetical protein